MAEIVSPASIHPVTRTPQTTDQQRGSFKGISVHGGIVQDATADINFDLRSGTANLLIAQRAGEKKRKAVLSDRASLIRRGAEKRASQLLGDFSEVYGALFRNFLTELKATQKKKRQSLSDLRDLAEQFFDDPSIRHAAVEAAAQMENQMGDSDGLEDMLRHLAQTLMEEEGPEIRAGYNINPAIGIFLGEGEYAATFRALRDAYRETLLSDAPEEQIYNFLVHILPSRLPHSLRRRRPNTDKERQKRTKPPWEDWNDVPEEDDH